MYIALQSLFNRLIAAFANCYVHHSIPPFPSPCSDSGELQQEVLELSHTNKRLTGENQELTSHLNLAEETNTNLKEQCTSLHHALQGCVNAETDSLSSSDGIMDLQT